MPRIEVVDRGWACGHGWGRVGTCSSVGGVELVLGGLCSTPREFLEVQAIVDDPAGPDIDEACIVC